MGQNVAERVAPHFFFFFFYCEHAYGINEMLEVKWAHSTTTTTTTTAIISTLTAVFGCSLGVLFRSERPNAMSGGVWWGIAVQVYTRDPGAEGSALLFYCLIPPQE